jgi:cytochrome c-type biogenesis protein CcmH/NrfG
MKTNKEPPKVEVLKKDEGISKGTLIMISFVSLLVGFILGATVVILKTQPRVAPTPAPMVGPKQSGKSTSADYEEEIRAAKSILQKDPNNLQALISLGDAYFDTDQYQQAIDAYSKALSVDTKNPDVRTDMGIMYRKSKQFDKAIEALRQASRDAPRHLNSRFNLGVVLKYDKKDFQGAIQAWEDFLKVVASDDGRVTMVKQEIQAMKAALSKK